MQGFDAEIIEGLDAVNAPDELPGDNTHPGYVLVKFYANKVYQPALSEKTGKNEYKTVVYVEETLYLGAFINRRPITDEVAIDEATGRWKVVRLAPGETPSNEGPIPKSDILKYKAQWNAFVRGTSQEPDGTPLEMLFKADPARAEAFKAYHITSVEHLASVTDGQLDQMPIGTRQARELARKMLAKIAAQAPSIALNNALEQKDREIGDLHKKLAELTEKLTLVLTQQVGGVESDSEAPKRRGRPRKVDALSTEKIEEI